MAPADTFAGTGTDDLSGRLLASRYRLNKVIAAGGMATVWEATDQLLGRRVAVKILHRHLARDDSFVRRFRAEAVAAARLSHPSIVSVYDTVADGDIDAIVMELVSGTTLRADLDEFGPLKLNAAIAVGTQVADALAVAHAAGLIHRDVKPANILLSADGRVLVADFGIAKAAHGSDMTEVGSMIGTAKYLAPEQVEGGAMDGRADLYALGVVLYEALTGRVPFLAETDAGTAFARLHRDPVPPRRLRPDIPPALESVIVHSLERRPEDRFHDATEMRNALADAGRAATSPPPVPRTPGVDAIPPPPPPRREHSAPPAPTADRVVMSGSTLPPPPEARTEPRRRPRRGVLTVVALAVIGVLLAAYGAFAPSPFGSSKRSGSALTVTRVGSFDPDGDNGSEKDDLLPNLVDPDHGSVWRTEAYPGPEFRSGGSDKAGVGFYVVLDQKRAVTGIDMRTPVGGWNAEVYVAPNLGPQGRPPATLADWGGRVASIDDAPDGAVEVSIPSTDGQAVLVWFTRATRFGNSYAVQISDVVVRGK
ncbi:MAG: protein kinase [Acidimicrobiales bacterium]|nr:protein kinase [Acidimicrobiales bacterium]